MLQFPIVSKESRGLYLPTKLQRAVINPEAFYNMVNNNSSLSTEGMPCIKSIFLLLCAIAMCVFRFYMMLYPITITGIPVTYCKKFDILKCHGVEIKGLKTSVAPRRTHVRTKYFMVQYYVHTSYSAVQSSCVCT